MTCARRVPKSILVVVALFVWVFPIRAIAEPQSYPPAPPRGPRFQVSFSADLHDQPITGRLFVILSKRNAQEPRNQVGNWTQQTPFFAVDVDQLRPEAAGVIDSTTLGFPLKSLRDVAAGSYYVQAVMNVYSQVHRSDGKILWVHMDQWEGQQFNTSPGNLYSDTQEIQFDPKSATAIRIRLNHVIPAISLPSDSKSVKHIKIQSKLLSDFWGHPMYVGATVLLPKGYDENKDQHYPVIYIQGHFSLIAPFGFGQQEGNDGGMPNLPGFRRAWDSDDFPRMIAVTLQHPTPFFDDSYAVNSANNGPYDDAIMKELIPYLEQHFRSIREPYARLLTGGSTGGWESLALQLRHPDFFGGVWSFYPDPVDFRRYTVVNIYDDDNAFLAPGFEAPVPERPIMRAEDGQIILTQRQFSQFEQVLGSHGRSGQQLEAWDAAFGPVGADGYPAALWDKSTGKINHDTAHYMQAHGFDLRAYLEDNWDSLGPKLKDKIHVFVGDADNYFLNLAVYLLENASKELKNPNFDGSFEYGRPLKGHGWQPMSNVDLVKMMANYVVKNSPAKTSASQSIVP